MEHDVSAYEREPFMYRGWPFFHVFGGVACIKKSLMQVIVVLAMDALMMQAQTQPPAVDHCRQWHGVRQQSDGPVGVRERSASGFYPSWQAGRKRLHRELQWE